MSDVVSEGRRLLAEAEASLCTQDERHAAALVREFAVNHLAALLDCADAARHAYDGFGVDDAQFYAMQQRLRAARLEGDAR